jgi:hypothetical protein
VKKIFSALLLCAAPVFAQESEWRGPLPVENERPFQAIFLHLPPQNPDVLPRGRAALGAQLDIANNLLAPRPDPNGARVVEDFETQRLKLSYRKGLGRGLEWGVSSNLTARNRGFLDAPIEWYHSLLNLDGEGLDNPPGRDRVPRHRSILFFQNAAGQGVNEGSAFGLGDTSFWLKKQLSQGRFSSAARVALKAPTGSEGKILGSGGFDVGFSVDARYQFAKRWAFFANAGAAKFGNSDIPGAKSGGWQAGMGFEWRISRRASIIAQMDAASRAVSTGHSFADHTPIIGSIGFKKQLSEKSAFWIALGENGDYHNYHAPFFGNIGPDSNLTFGYEWRR